LAKGENLTIFNKKSTEFLKNLKKNTEKLKKMSLREAAKMKK